MSYGYANQDLNRYKNPVIRTVGDNTVTRNYVAYFDSGASESRSIVFYGFKTGTTQANVQTAAGNLLYYIAETAANKLEQWIPLASTPVPNPETGISLPWYANIDKYYEDAEDAFVTPSGLAENNKNGIATPRGRQNVTTVNGNADSQDFDLGVRVVTAGVTHYGFIAYFDETAQKLYIKANEGLYSADPAYTPGTWTPAFKVDDDAGADVSMAIDPAGGIHLAYQHTASGYLKYAYLTYNAATDTFTVGKQVFVDALFGSGTSNSIYVRDFGSADYRPVITTYSNALAGTKAALRTSYPIYSLVNANFGDGADSATSAFTGKWETVAIPALGTPESLKTYTYGNSASGATVGYKSNASLEQATYLGF
jgi:hypothetical protein